MDWVTVVVMVVVVVAVMVVEMQVDTFLPNHEA
jgi:hypothetical protein